MHRLICLLFTALSLSSLRADIIVNGDFHDGKANWKGDLRAASDQGDNGEYDMSSIDKQSTGAGVVIALKNTWTKIYQTFDSQGDSLDYSITYKTSLDYASSGFSSHNGLMPYTRNPANPDPGLFLSMLLGSSSLRSELKPPRLNEILVLALDFESNTYSEARFTITPSADKPQTATGTLGGVPPHDEKQLYIVFPSGTGSLTLLNVALTPHAAAANP